MSGIPRTTTAVVMTAPRLPLEVREVPIPPLEEDSALLRVERSEVCGTDVHLHEGRLAGVPYPIIPGHVSAGVLSHIRGRIEDVHGRSFAEGDRVTFLDVHRTCHRCWYCLVAGASTRCPHRKVYGITYGLADGPCGGWARHVYLKPGVRCIRLDGVDTERFMAGGCALPTALHAVQRGEATIGDRVLVLGAGPVGLSAVALSVLRGASSVLCVGAPASRREVARQMGADDVLDFTTCPVEERITWVRERTDGFGADVTIECTGSPSAVVEAMRYTRDAGTVVVVGQYTDAGDAAFNPHEHLNRPHLTICGCWGSDYAHFHRGVRMLAVPRIAEPWSRIPLTRYRLGQMNDALQEVASGGAVKALVIPET